MSRRTERVSVLLREEISRLIHEDLHDPRVARLVTILRVDVSADLEHATARITVLGDSEQEQAALAALEAATGFLRREIGRRMKLKRATDLKFVLDQSIQEGDHVLALLDSLKSQESPEDD